MLADFFTLIAGVWTNGRVEEELTKARARIDAARLNGKKGGRKPKDNPAGTQQEPSGFIPVKPIETQPEPSAKLTIYPPNHLTSKDQKHLVQLAARFDEFWQAYPIRKGKAAALAKWKARKLDGIADQIIADVKARIAGDRQWIDGYAPHGSTYVNASGWEDAIEPPKSGNGSGGYKPLPGEI